MMQNTALWERLLDKYGLPLAFLAIVLAFLWFVGRPVVKYLLDMINTQLSESRAARQADSEKFLKSLETFQQSADRQTDAMRKVAEHLDELRNEIRRK